MKRLAAGTVCALVAICLAYATAGAQGTKTVRGEATKVAPDSITVQVGGQSMTFKVDAKTTGDGARRLDRCARSEGGRQARRGHH